MSPHAIFSEVFSNDNAALHSGELRSYFAPLVEAVVNETDSDYFLCSLLKDDELKLKLVYDNPQSEFRLAEGTFEVPSKIEYPIEARRCKESWGRSYYLNGYGDQFQAEQLVREFNQSIREKAWFWLSLGPSNVALVCLLKMRAKFERERYTADEVLTSWFKSQRFVLNGCEDRVAKAYLNLTDRLFELHSVLCIEDSFRRACKLVLSADELGWESITVVHGSANLESAKGYHFEQIGPDTVFALSLEDEHQMQIFHHEENFADSKKPRSIRRMWNTAGQEFQHGFEGVDNDRALSFVCIAQKVRDQLSNKNKDCFEFALPIVANRHLILILVRGMRAPTLQQRLLTTLLLEWIGRIIAEVDSSLVHSVESDWSETEIEQLRESFRLSF